MILHSNKEALTYYSYDNELTLKKEESNISEIIELSGCEGEYYKQYKNCLILCNGKKIAVICNPGKISLRKDDYCEKILNIEYEEKIDSIEVYDNYITINNDDVIIVEEKKVFSFSTGGEVDATHIKDIKNMQQIQEKYISTKDFIKNENGCFCTSGFSEEEKLKLYKEQGFTDLYEKLELEIMKKQEAQRKEEKMKEEARNKTNEYLEGKVLSLCHIRRSVRRYGKIIEAGHVDFVENDNAVLLYEIQEKGWPYGPVYESGIINISEAKKRIRGGKLHLDVPEEAMGKIIGIKGYNIDKTTKELQEKGLDLSKIILHPKSKEEIKIKLEKIENAIKKQKEQERE